MILVSAVTAMCMVGGTMAYLTDSERTINKFQVGKVDIQLTEPSWVEASNQQIQPTSIIPKDPQITNVGINDAFVYLEVKIPMANVVTADTTGMRVGQGIAQNQELFTFTPEKNWSQIKKKTVDGNMVYTYAYNKILAKTQKTTALFENVTFANVIEGQIDENKYDISVSAYAIQTEHTGGDGVDIPAQAKAAYEKYANQNLGKIGAVQVLNE